MGRGRRCFIALILIWGKACRRGDDYPAADVREACRMEQTEPGQPSPSSLRDLAAAVNDRQAVPRRAAGAMQWTPASLGVRLGASAIDVVIVGCIGMAVVLCILRFDNGYG